ncbi:Ger(x)C family spore germination protein [Ferroacidibacillus organovorans]|uniref:Uncharacterized protein n=1 Tax=Ferroacidibacillus organovorans TaxID=1765683 RepID=A0A101XS39_9BACL|nr:Ger(x)C family spore germination protein [Ferroacidibacillus organovorans]KUO96510.1 hypothetical protein ATW55_01245 [Ferroacidibacillus organovorans]
MRRSLRFAVLVAIGLSITPLLSGCWDRLEIEERGTILGIAIDPLEGQPVQNITGPAARGVGYKITAQIAIPGRIPLGPTSGGGGMTERPVWILSVTGKTVDDAMSRLQEDLADQIFIGQMRVIIVNEKIARTTGMHALQDYFRRNAETRRLIWMMISHGDAEEVLQASPKLERVPTLYLVGTMEHAVNLGKIPNVFLGNYWSTLASFGRDPVLPVISKVKDRINLDGLALFRGEKMVGVLNSLQVAPYMELTNQKQAGYGFSVPLPDEPNESASLKGTIRHTIIKLSMRHQKPFFDIHVIINGNIQELTSTKHQLRGSLMNKLSVASAAILQEKQVKFLKRMKKLGIDPIGFGEYVRAQYPDYWRRIGTRDRWDQIFAKDVSIHLHNTFTVVRSGLASH